MEIEKIGKLEQNVFAGVTYYRLLKDLEIIEGKMAKKEPYSSERGKTAIENFWNKKIANPIRKKSTDRLSVVKNGVLSEIDNFKKRCVQEQADLSCAESEEVLKAEIDGLFAEDKYGIQKIYFAIRVALVNDVKFVNETETLEKVSELFFGDKHKIPNIYDDLKDNYVAIYKKPISDVEKGVLIGMGIFCALSVTALPLGLAFGAASSPILTSCLAQIGHSASYVIGSGLATVTATAAISSLVVFGGTYLGAEIYKEWKTDKVKESFRNISGKDLSLIFAIKATVIQHAKKVVSEENMKLVLDDCLKQINDLRSDAEYMLIVEKLNAGDAKEKISVCNRLTQRLADIVGI